MSIKITVLSVLIAGLSLCGARADIVLQPGPGANDGTDDGSASSGKDASTWKISTALTGNGGAEAVLTPFNSPCNVGVLNSYLQFSTAGLPAQGVTKAEIQVYCKVYSQGDGWPWQVSPQLSVRRVTQPWNEMTVTVATAPAVDPLVVDTHTVSVVGGGGAYTEYEGWLSFDVTSLYLAWASGATNNYGIEFRIDNEYCANGDIFAINSSDHTNALLRPKLVLKGVDLPPRVLTSDASFGVRTNQFGFTITGTSNLVIVVEACTNLAQPAWSPVGTNNLVGGSSYFSDPVWTNYPGRFYRLRAAQ
jgi:hypothetical protein